jgi:hypothetical protein
VNADWIKKEKLTVLETKEDKKNETRNKVQVKTKDLVPGQSVNEENAQLLGFKSKESFRPPQRNREEEKPARDNKKPRENAGKNKIVINDDEFPTL